jgi:hypothetical protein
MENLTREQLMQLLTLNGKSEPPKKARKKAELDADKKAEMLERLEKMRATVAENRKAKKEETDLTKTVENPMTVFEKRYESKFDKMTELLSDLNVNTKAVADLKREKKQIKEKEKADKDIAEQQKQEAQLAMRKLQEEQLEIARTQQYARGTPSGPPTTGGIAQQQQPPQIQTRPTVQAPPAPNMPNALAKFSRPKPQQW